MRLGVPRNDRRESRFASPKFQHGAIGSVDNRAGAEGAHSEAEVRRRVAQEVSYASRRERTSQNVWPMSAFDPQPTSSNTHLDQHCGWGQLGHLQIPGRGRQRLTLLVLQYPNGVHVPAGQ
jgi:hypothetical protein